MAECKSIVTRKRLINCPIFGKVKRMNQNVLPTVQDILEEYKCTRHDLKNKPKKEPKVSEIINILIEKIDKIRKRAFLPTVTRDRMIQLARKHHDKYLKLIRYPSNKKTVFYEQKIKRFKEDSKSTLFDIASCKCSNSTICRCPKNRKIS